MDARRLTARALADIDETLGREHAVRVVAAGKAAVGMATAVDRTIGDRMAAGVMTAAADAPLPARWRAFAGTHPTPSAGSEAAGRAALALADEARAAGGLLLVCLSGGASAMLAVPAPGLTIDEKLAATRRLLRAGLDIAELNVVRRHLSAVKGGQLAARAGRSVTLAISDVCTPVEDDPRVIGSGPTSADDSTFADALQVIDRHGLRGELPPDVMKHLEAGQAGRVAGPVPSGDSRLRQAAYWIVGSRHDAMRAAAEVARRLGYGVTVIEAPTIGEARHAGRDLVDRVRTLERPHCLITSGETTVRVTGRGRGGRNQELAVAAMEPLAGLAPAALASIGTDGVDGPTDAAGAFVGADTIQQLGVDATATIAEALDRNDAYPLLERLGCLIRTGPTGTNVGDLQVVLLPQAR